MTIFIVSNVQGLFPPHCCFQAISLKFLHGFKTQTTSVEMSTLSDHSEFTSYHKKCMLGIPWQCSD